MTPFEEQTVIESMFKIQPKDPEQFDGSDIPFLLNRHQRRVLYALTGRDIILKARQLGFSWLILARMLARCLTMKNRRCVVVSHEARATQKLLARVHYMLKHMPAPAQMSHKTSNYIEFNSTDSSFYIGTAGSDDFGVGDTITDLHCSEVPRWPNPIELLRGLFPAVPSTGSIIMEATGKGVGNYYHRACVRAREGFGYKLHFFPWTEEPDYSSTLTDEQAQHILSTLDKEEQDLVSFHSLTPGQLSWRRDRIVEFDFDTQVFKENYPVTFDECFQSRGTSFFQKVNVGDPRKWLDDENRPFEENGRHVGRLYHLEGHPRPGYLYVAGCDIGAGVGRSNSTLEVFCLDTQEQVGEFATNREEPDVFAASVHRLLAPWGFPYLNPESNNHGLLAISELRKLYPNTRLHRGKVPDTAPQEETQRLATYGTFLTEPKRILGIGRLRSNLAHSFTIYSPLLKGELDTFIEHASGALGPEEGCLSDRVMAAMHALTVMEKAVQRRPLERMAPKGAYHPFTLEAIISELEGRYEGVIH